MSGILAAILALAGVQDPSALRASGREKAARGDFAGAEADFSRLLDVDPKDVAAILDRGNARASQESWDRAIADFTEALRLDPGRWAAAYGRGLARKARGDLEGALTDLSRAVELAPREALPYLSRAQLRWGLGDAPGAIADYSCAIERYAALPAAYAGRGLVRDAQGDLAGALADLDEAVHLRSADPQVFMSRGRILFFHERSYGRALDDLGTAVRLAPRSPFGWLLRAFADLELDRSKAAFEDATRALDLLPDSAEALQVRGLARRNLGDGAGAIADFTRAIDLGDPDGASARYRAYAAYDQGEWKSALEDFKRSAERAPETRDYAEWRSYLCRLNLGDADGAARALREYRATRAPRTPSDWPGQIGAYLDRAISEDAFLRSASTDAQRCEASFYVASRALGAGNRDRARDGFLECQRTSKIDSFEYAGARAALAGLAPHLVRPPVLAGRTKIEIHRAPGAATDAPGGEAGSRPDPWRILVDEAECAEPERLFAQMGVEAAREPGEMPGSTRRRVLIWADAEVPYRRVAEVLSACHRAGLAGTALLEFRSEGPPLESRRPGEEPVPWGQVRPGEEDLGLDLSWVGGNLRARVGQGPWIADLAEVRPTLWAAGAGKERPLWIAPEDDVPAGLAFRMLDRCRGWGLKEADFQPPGFRHPGPRPWGAVRPEEAEALGRRLEEAVGAGTPEALDRAMARQEILRRTVGEAALSASAARLVDSLIGDLALTGRRFPRTPSPLRPLKFLRLRIVDGAPRPLFRILDRDRYDYVEFELGKGYDGSLYILEVGSLEMGGPQSLFLRRACLPPVEDLERLNGLRAPTVGDIAESYRDCGELNALVFERKFALALKFFDDHRASLARDPAAHRSHLRAARQMGAAEYLKAIGDLERELPRDSLLLLLRVDGFFMAGDYDRAIEAVGALEQAVGDDPFLLVYRANLELVNGHARKAQELAERAAAREPTLDRAWWALLNAAAKDRDHAAGVRALNRLEKTLNIPVPDLRTSAGYEDFTQSEEFREWLGGRP